MCFQFWIDDSRGLYNFLDMLGQCKEYKPQGVGFLGAEKEGAGISNVNESAKTTYFFMIPQPLSDETLLKMN